MSLTDPGFPTLGMSPGPLNDLPRRLGAVGPCGGPALLCVGGLHGNEPSGVLALQRVIRRLEGDPSGLVGRIAAFVGNRSALAVGDRYLDSDMNRVWTVERLCAARASAGELENEDRELVELAAELEGELERSPRARVLDLHSMSAEGPAFVTLDDSLANRAMARALPVPWVLGLEEEISGTLVSYFTERGVIGIGFEAGRHEDPGSVDRAEAAVWILLESGGVLERGARAEVEASRRRLADDDRARAGLVEVRYRHAVRPSDEFVMLPGYTSFQPVRRGEPLADDVRGAVLSPRTGMILMPLYQKRGSDGFFLIQRVHPAWLSLSAVLRRTPIERGLHWLPGVSRHPSEHGVYRVDLRRARWLARQLFHLLGFRRRSIAGHVMEMVRREG